MKFDRNTLIGFALLAVLFLGYFLTTSKEQAKYREKMAREKFVKDSIQQAQAREQFIRDSLANPGKVKTDAANLNAIEKRTDSLSKINKAGIFYNTIDTSEKLVFVDNDLMHIAFTNKGGRIKYVELKKFRSLDSGWVKLAGSEFDKISYSINTGSNSSAQTSDLFFSFIDTSKNADGSTSLSYVLMGDTGLISIIHKYVIRPNDYMIDYSVEMKGADKLLTQGVMNLVWQYKAAQQESSISFEKQNTQIGYRMDGDFDYHTIMRRSSKDFEKPVQWIGVRQRFFNGILLAKNNFTKGNIEWSIPPDSAKTIVESTANLKIELPVASSAKVDFSIFYGPADYHILKKYDLKLDKLINLGQGPYAFVRPVNRFLVMPIFDFMKSFVGSFGLAIALLTIIIRLLISPLTYSSYLSGAKMKVLRPEIAALREKYGNDQQQMSMEQMKLFREAGVNPLGGCIPALLQIPIFFALYSFFNSNVDLRGQSFLWAKDLSAFDDLIHWGNVPVLSYVLGDHLSLFTITAVVTSFLISLYSMSITPDQSNPVLKYMPYIFPVFLLFIFNRLPSALTWYYTVSNIITLALQYIILNYIIDHDKILAKMEANRKKPKTKSKWQERFEQMQEQQKKVKEMQQKGKR
jgi:YidC/Oxa1 family membrane protein insertase